MAIKHDEINIKAGKENIVVMIYDTFSENYVGDVILTPAYGITARSMFSFAYYLAANGYRVYCLDYRNHVGKSTGDIMYCKLSTQVEDVLAVLEATKCNKIVSLSLSCRSTIKACAEYNGSVDLVLVTPVVNTAKTVFAASGVDYFTIVDDTSDLTQKANILGNVVQYNFVQDAVQNKMDSLNSTIEDLAKIKGNLTCIAGDLDPWVDINDVKYVLGAVKTDMLTIKLNTIHAAAHKINRNPVVAGKYYEESTRECLNMSNVDSTNIIIPNMKEIIRDIGYEKIKVGENHGISK